MPGPLAGIRVVELSTMITAPLTGMMLADLGAEVIKLENPEGGDAFRSYGGGDYSAQFCSYNRGKRSVAISLKTDAGRAAFEALLRAADVLLENFRPGVMARLGYPGERLAAINPRLVHCSITGFGGTGPYAQRPCYDAIAQSLSGMSSQFLDPAEPRLSGTTIADNVTGQYAAYGILAALFERQRTGVARRVEVNVLEATMAFMPEPFAYCTQNGQHADAYLRVRNSQAYAFRCRDGKLVATHMASQQKFFEAFLVVVGRPELARDTRFSTLAKRVDNYEEFRRLVGESFARHDRDEWLRRFAASDVPFAPINSIEDVFDDPQVRALDSFFELQHPRRGRLTSIRRPVLFDGQRDDQGTRPPPALGEHTQEVLAELGMAFPPGGQWTATTGDKGEAH